MLSFHVETKLVLFHYFYYPPVLRPVDLQLPDAAGRLHQSHPGATPRPTLLQATAVSRLSPRAHVPPFHPRPGRAQPRVGDVPLRLALDHDHPRANGPRKCLECMLRLIHVTHIHPQTHESCSDVKYVAQQLNMCHSIVCGVGFPCYVSCLL